MNCKITGTIGNEYCDYENKVQGSPHGTNGNPEHAEHRLSDKSQNAGKSRRSIERGRWGGGRDHQAANTGYAGR